MVLKMKAGITMEMSDGMNISVITPSAVMTPLFHSMMVVTSPMGEKAPPELAAMMTSEAYMMRSLWSLTSLRSIMIMTIDVVRLSSMAERKKVMNAMRHSNTFLLLVWRVSLTKLNPPFWSTSSTIVMAPMRKNSVVAVLPRWGSISALTMAAFISPMASTRYCDGSIMNSVQHTTNMSKAMAALLIFVTLSMAMRK